MKQIFALVLAVAAALVSDTLAAASFQPRGLGPGATQSFAWAVSADGSVVVGSHWVPSESAFNQQAFRWASGIFQDLGPLNPNAPEAQALGMSDDGTRVVGWSRAIGGFQRPFLWTPANGMQEIPDIPGSDAVASDISGDGKTIVGYFLDFDGHHAFRWDGGAVTDLGFLPDGRDSKAQAVCGLGTAVVGSTLTSDLAQRAFRWQADTGMQNLGGLPEVQTSYAEDWSSARALTRRSICSPRAEIPLEFTAGHVGRKFQRGSRGFRERRRDRRRSRTAVCQRNLGVLSLPLGQLDPQDGTTQPNSGEPRSDGCSILPSGAVSRGHLVSPLALGISPDGNVIVGFARDPDGKLQAYRAVMSTTSEEGGACPTGFTPLTLTVTTELGAEAGSVSSKQDSSSGQQLVVSSGQAGSACFQSNDTLVLEAADKRLADWSGDPVFACKDGSFGENRCEIVLETASQSVTATLK